MDASHMKRLTVKQVFMVQMLVSFAVIGIFIAMGGLLVFRVMGTGYTPFTSAGFIAAVYLAFITFQPAGTLYAARSELIQGKVDTGTIQAGPDESPRNPWAMTLGTSLPVAILCTAIAVGLIYGVGWNPTPALTVLAALLYVVPHFLITARFMGRDLAVFASRGLGSGKRAGSLTGRIWGVYVLPNLVFQGIINGALGTRAFSQEALKLTKQFPDLTGLVPSAAVSMDLVFTFVFVCGFTALAATTYMLSDLFQGIMPMKGKGLKMNGFLLFLLILFMGICTGVVYGIVLHGLGYLHLPLGGALVSKLSCVFAAVVIGVYLGKEWVKAKAIERMQGG